MASPRRYTEAIRLARSRYSGGSVDAFSFNAQVADEIDMLVDDELENFTNANALLDDVSLVSSLKHTASRLVSTVVGAGRTGHHNTAVEAALRRLSTALVRAKDGDAPRRAPGYRASLLKEHLVTLLKACFCKEGLHLPSSHTTGHGGGKSKNNAAARNWGRALRAASSMVCGACQNTLPRNVGGVAVKFCPSCGAQVDSVR